MITHFPGNDSGPLKKLQRVKFKNVNAAQVPAFGVMRITDLTIDAEESYLSCDQPNTFGAQSGTHAINGPLAVDSGSYGYCFPGPETMLALYDSGDGTPAALEHWGPRSGSWKLKKSTGGFRIRKVSDSDNAIVIVSLAPMTSFFCKNLSGSDIGEGATGTVTILAGSAGSEATTGVTITARSRWGVFPIDAIGRCTLDQNFSSVISWTVAESDTCGE